MRLPLINLPTVYHLGTLDPALRGTRFSSSHEGAGLSVSLCPDAWCSIARLGGEPLHALCRPDAWYLDLKAIADREMAEILGWAAGKGLVEFRDMWRAWSWDSELGEWCSMTFASRNEAVDEVLASAGMERNGETDEELLAAARDFGEDADPGAPGSLVTMERMPLLTVKGNRRAYGFGRGDDASDMAVMFWAEDVARKSFPSLVGVWWRESYDPENLSAPRGAVFPSCVNLLNAIASPSVGDDEELLDGMPETRLVTPEAMRSPYGYVTCCVHSTAELISPMVDNPACRNLTLDEFLAEAGGVKAGRALLDRTFPVYRKSGMDIRNDWAVRYHASQFDGLPCIFVVHSAIEYVFQRRGLREAMIAGPVIRTGRQDPAATTADYDGNGMPPRAYRG